jgi:peptidoglycan/LPS O-acetylase OafA/YrhL
MASWLRLPSTQVGGAVLVKKRAWQIVIISVSIKILTYIVVYISPQVTNEIEALRVLSWIGLFSALNLAAVVAEGSSLVIRFLSKRPLLFLGKYSYGIYVFHHFLSWPSLHYQIVPLMAEKLGNLTVAMLANALVGAGVSILMALVSYHAFEKHFLRLKDILAPSLKA